MAGDTPVESFEWAVSDCEVKSLPEGARSDPEFVAATVSLLVDGDPVEQERYAVPVRTFIDWVRLVFGRLTAFLDDNDCESGQLTREEVCAMWDELAALRDAGHR
jgi:hypothetical protein